MTTEAHESIHTKYEELFREFMVVGGMPEAVADFALNKDFGRVLDIQTGILEEYKDDISKHAKGKEKQLVRMCYDAVPKQLAKELKKFQYSTVEKVELGISGYIMDIEMKLLSGKKQIILE